MSGFAALEVLVGHLRIAWSFFQPAQAVAVREAKALLEAKLASSTTAHESAQRQAAELVAAKEQLEAQAAEQEARLAEQEASAGAGALEVSERLF